MKKLIFLLFILVSFQVSAQVNYDKYFTNNTLRLDYVIAGDSQSHEVFFEQLKQEGIWSGTRTNLIDPFPYGEYRVMVFDIKSGQMIFSHGYASLYSEWQSTTEAKNIKRSFYETVLIPFPKNKVKVKLYARDRKTKLNQMFEMEVDPKNYFIRKEKKHPYRAVSVIGNDAPEKNIDIVFLPDGYTKTEMDKFHKDVKRFADALLNTSPFDEYQDRFNVWLIEAPSKDSGPDIPGKHIWKNTPFNTSFYTFDSERYLMTLDMKNIRDASAAAPYDQIVILVNTDKYGGGGVYNYYNTFSSDNAKSIEVWLHEFGHGLVGLADEYYTSDVAYNDYFDLSVEPVQANITTLKEFHKKWKNMVTKGNPIPTPRQDKYLGTVGAFEGGGYVAKGIYSPSIKCRMNWIEDEFCPVCKKAIVEMIKYYTE